MRRFRVNYESFEAIWLFYIGIGVIGLSLLYMLFFASKWPYPSKPFIALLFSFLLSGSFMAYGHINKDRELFTRKTYLSIGLGAYILWFVLYVRATIYCNAGSAYHIGLTVLLVLALILIVYSFAVKGNKFPILGNK